MLKEQLQLNGILAASDSCLRNQLKSYNSIVLQMFFEQGESSNRQKINGCFFRQILFQNVSRFLF